MENLLKQYRNLEIRTFNLLRQKIINSNFTSDFIKGLKCINVEFENFSEAVILNDNITLLDTNGVHYSVFSVSLENLINEI